MIFFPHRHCVLCFLVCLFMWTWNTFSWYDQLFYDVMCECEEVSKTLVVILAEGTSLNHYRKSNRMTGVHTFSSWGLYYFVFESLCVWVLLFMQLQGLLCCHTVSFISLHLTSLSDRSLPCHILQLQDTKDRISKTLAISRKP